MMVVSRSLKMFFKSLKMFFEDHALRERQNKKTNQPSYHKKRNMIPFKDYKHSGPFDKGISLALSPCLFLFLAAESEVSWTSNGLDSHDWPVSQANRSRDINKTTLNWGPGIMQPRTRGPGRPAYETDPS